MLSIPICLLCYILLCVNCSNSYSILVQQLILQKKLGRDTLEEEDEEEEEEEVDKGAGEGVESKAGQGSASVGIGLEASASTATPPISALSTPTKKEQVKSQGSTENLNWERRRSSRRSKRASLHSIGSRKWSSASSRSDSLQLGGSEHSGLKRLSSGGLNKVAATAESDEEPVRWGLDQIELSDSDSDLEFFDAKGQYACTKKPHLLVSLTLAVSLFAWRAWRSFFFLQVRWWLRFQCSGWYCPGQVMTGNSVFQDLCKKVQ